MCLSSIWSCKTTQFCGIWHVESLWHTKLWHTKRGRTSVTLTLLAHLVRLCILGWDATCEQGASQSILHCKPLGITAQDVSQPRLLLAILRSVHFDWSPWTRASVVITAHENTSTDLGPGRTHSMAAHSRAFQKPPVHAMTKAGDFLPFHIFLKRFGTPFLWHSTTIFVPSVALLAAFFRFCISF